MRLPKSASAIAFWISAVILIGLWLATAPALSHRGLDAGFYLDAAQRVAQGRSPYEQGGDYIYPPALAAALSLVPCSRDELNLAWNALMLFSVVLAVALGLRASGLPLQPWSALACLLLFTQPIRWGLQLGNASLLLAGLLAVAAALLFRWPALSGALIGVAALLKVTPLIFLAWLAALYYRHRTRSWLAALLAAGIVVLLGAASGDSLGYLHAKAADVQSRVALGANFSILSVIERASGWSIPGAIPALLGMSAALLVGLRTPPTPGAVRASWGIVQLLAIVSTPIAWSHLFVLAYWPALLAAGELLREPRRAEPRAQQLDLLLYALALIILARTALWYSPEDILGRVVLPLVPLLALFIVGAFLMRALREPRVEHVAGHARG